MLVRPSIITLVGPRSYAPQGIACTAVIPVLVDYIAGLNTTEPHEGLNSGFRRRRLAPTNR